MKRRITVLALSAMLLAPCWPIQAQQTKKVSRVGFLLQRVSPTPTTPDPFADAFRQGLRDLGYIEGKNILIEYRYAEGKRDRTSSQVAELVQLKVDVLVVRSISAIRVAKQASKMIPIVMVTTQDPVATGLIGSLARPGGNITGLTGLTRELSGKRLELLKEAVPGISRVGVLRNADSAEAANVSKHYEAAARALKIQLQSLDVRAPNPDYEGAFQAAAKGRASAIITVTGPLTASYPKRIADLAIKYRLPSMYEGSNYVEAGGLMSYSSSDTESFRRAATMSTKFSKAQNPLTCPSNSRRSSSS